MVDRVVTGARYGLRDWLMQRVTSVVMALYAVFFAIYFCAQSPQSYAAWRALFAPQWVRVLTMLFLVSLFLHAWVGVRDIYMDYFKSAGLRLLLQVLTIVALAGYTIWSASILWSS
jgi:succinate dehydrogenase / fumarate reductase, membrane anchor subunit